MSQTIAPKAGLEFLWIPMVKSLFELLECHGMGWTLQGNDGSARISQLHSPTCLPALCLPRHPLLYHTIHFG